MVSGAIRTDFILSAEIMAISLATIEADDLVTRAIVLAAVGIAITIAVYGVVALIVKADDIGAAMARGRGAATRAIGRALVVGMPRFLALLSLVGTVAMLWVGGGILIHGVAAFGWHAPEDLIHDFAHTLAVVAGALEAAAAWLLTALASGVVGFGIGAAILGVLGLVRRQPAHG
ncbi:Membrane protein, putative [Rubellimicrobium mesophilum DSM 19309]|uniref:Membrane protein, putative n=1 Tax=Rubellimicrobium mesophilum DSM 19309 TaxID=442562 RepID=A0A017HMB9_9RHOB|nr:Membrane protein, putative [Rubellimicrobium mesophilum DSM 19309]